MLAATLDDLWVGTHWIALYVNGDFQNTKHAIQ